MRADDYATGHLGRPHKAAGRKWTFTYYLPASIPRAVDLSPTTVNSLAEASSELGRLSGLGELIGQPEMLLGPFLTREALASSRIEGTNASLSDVLQAEASEEHATADPNLQEVSNYLAANKLGMQLTQKLPITQRLVKQVHETLLQGVRGKEKLPGEIRNSPVWVGGTGPENAKFVPPLPEELPELLRDWEVFVIEPPALPILVRCALMHYQFETIHPFLDGNGRIGRLLIGLMLAVSGTLSKPLLYLSGYFETHRSEYYDRLQAVREKEDLDSYLGFFFNAVSAAAAKDAAARANGLVELREGFYANSRLDRSRVNALIPLIFGTPFISTKRVQNSLSVTSQGARNLLSRAESYGWLEPRGPIGQGGMHLWLSSPVMEVIRRPITYDFGE